MMHSAHFDLRLYGVGHTVKDHRNNKRGNTATTSWTTLPISNKISFVCVCVCVCACACSMNLKRNSVAVLL